MMLLNPVFNAKAAQTDQLDKLIEESNLLMEPIVIYDGITITPQEWFIDRQFTDATMLMVKFSVDNQTQSNIQVEVKYRTINDRVIENSYMSTSGTIHPGESGSYVMGIDEYILVAQRIEKISDLNVYFMVRFVEPEDGKDVVKKCILADPVSIASGSRVETKSFDGEKVYRDENLVIMASSVLREFPGAYCTSVYIQNNSDLWIKGNTRVIAINGNELESKSLLDFDARNIICPEKEINIRNIVYLKNQNGNPYALMEIKTVTLSLDISLNQIKDFINGFEEVKQMEPIIFTIDIE